MNIRLGFVCTIGLFCASGCATTLSVQQKDSLYARAQQVFQRRDGFLFYDIPSFGHLRNSVFMKQQAVTGRPTKAVLTLFGHLKASDRKDVCLAVTGASSARVAHVVKEAFALLPIHSQTPHLQLFFVGDKAFETELRKLTEDRGGTFFFEELEPET